MAIEIIRKREWVENVRYSLYYEYKDCAGAGYMFDCDEDGNIELGPEPNIRVDSYAEVLENENKYWPARVLKFVNRYAEPAVGKCGCGAEVSLSDPLGNSCECGRAYNMSGQEVIPDYGRAECAEDGWFYDDDY